MDERQDFGGTNQMPGLKKMGVVPRVSHIITPRAITAPGLRGRAPGFWRHQSDARFKKMGVAPRVSHMITPRAITAPGLRGRAPGFWRHQSDARFKKNGRGTTG